MNVVLKSKISISDMVIAYIYGIIVFLLMEPYYMWNTGRLPMYLSLILVVITFLNLRKLSFHDIFVIPMFLFWFLYLYSYTNLFGYFGKSAILSFLFLKKEKALLYLNTFKSILAIVLSLSLTMYLLVVVLSIPVDYTYISPLNVLKGFKYSQYPFLLLENISNVNNVMNIRFCSVFDEPGTVGSFSAMLLFSDKYNLNKKQNWIFLISGIASFSFFFYISSLIYLIYLQKNKVRIIIITVFGAFYYFTKNIFIIRYLIWERFMIEDGKVSGDNRATERLDDVFEGFWDSGDVLWGYGARFSELNDLQDSSSYKLLIIDQGMVFFTLLCLSFILLAIFTIRNTKYSIGYILLFLGMMYQRPGMIFYPAYLFVMIFTIYAISKYAKNENNLKFTPKNQIKTIKLSNEKH
jgi:hypothetical protein